MIIIVAIVRTGIASARNHINSYHLLHMNFAQFYRETTPSIPKPPAAATKLANMSHIYID